MEIRMKVGGLQNLRVGGLQNLISQNLEVGGLQNLEIDVSTGLLATPSYPEEAKIMEVFVEGSEPITPCDLHDNHSRRAGLSLFNW